jgi:predicted transcriptional regulator
MIYESGDNRDIEQVFFEQVKKNTMQQTSLSAYEQIKDKLGEKQLRVVEVLRHFKNASNMEIASALEWSINRVTPRVLELRNMGLIEPVGLRTCMVTGKNVNVWRLKQNGITSWN